MTDENTSTSVNEEPRPLSRGGWRRLCAGFDPDQPDALTRQQRRQIAQPNATFLVELIQRLNLDDPTMAEIGVNTGQASQWLLHEVPTLQLLMVDSWESHDKESPYRKTGDKAGRRGQAAATQALLDAVYLTQFASDRRKVLVSDSVEAAKYVGDHSLGLVFIDGDHSYEGVLRDIRAWAGKVAHGGILAGHDYGHPRDRRGIFGVSKATKEVFDGHAVLRSDPKSTVWWLEPFSWRASELRKLGRID